MARRRRSSGSASRAKPRKGKPPRADADSPWKESLDQYFEPCLAFFFTDAHAEIDWSRGYEPLDKELQPIVRQSKQGRRYVDKLVKVRLKTGEEKWLLIHVEVQARRDREFPRRMLVYNHRIFDRYDHETVSLAILADDDPSWRPDRYEYGRWGFRALIEFPVVKLLDHAGQYERLESDPNPFAVVVLAHLKAMETRRSPAERHLWKVRLVKGRTAAGWARRTCGGCSGSSTGSWSCPRRWKNGSGTRSRPIIRRTRCRSSTSSSGRRSRGPGRRAWNRVSRLPLERIAVAWRTGERWRFESVPEAHEVGIRT